MSVEPQKTVTPPAAVDLDLDAGVRHVVPVDGQPGAADVGRARDARCRGPGAELPVLPRASRRLDHLLEALAAGRWCAAAGSPSSVSGVTRVSQPQLGGIEPEVLGDLVELDSSAKRGCGVPWPRLGPQGGLLVKTRMPSNL